MDQCNIFFEKNPSIKHKVIFSTFYLTFPSNEEKKQHWLKLIDRESWNPPFSTKICSDHFKESVIKHGGDGVTLMKGALPSRLKNSAEYTKYNSCEPLHSILHDHNYSVKYSTEKESQFRILPQEINEPQHLAIIIVKPV